jgi:diadenosine tetraphosphatase ApaH/serine/threonine PP2A family protein phosphatase
MRYLVISDIHANLEALDATLAASGECDHVLLLGDLVGYGADPNAVIARIRALPAATIIRGNHDKVAAGLEDVHGFNHLARQAIAWTSAELTPDNRAWLAGIPQGPMLVEPRVEICHGAPFDEDCYVFDDLDATRALRLARAPLCLFGHTHVPTVFRMDTVVRHAGSPAASHDGELTMVGPPRGSRFRLTLDADARYLVNCGAVGQPRDSDPQAAFGLLDIDDQTLTIVRVPYDVAAAQAKIVAAGLPGVLAQRLALGR